MHTEADKTTDGCSPQAERAQPPSNGAKEPEMVAEAASEVGPGALNLAVRCEDEKSTLIPLCSAPEGAQAPLSEGPLTAEGPTSSRPHSQGLPVWQTLKWRACRWPAAGLLFLVLLIPLFRSGITHTRTGSEATAEGQTPIVPVVKVTRTDLYNEVTIPAEFRPYLQVELHAKVSGYVQEIKVDIGDQVKAGQLLARLEVPELRDELDRARAAEQRAEADYKDAHLAHTRLVAVNHDHPNLVAEQDLDTAEAKAQTAAAAVAGAKADVERYQTLVGYTQITAPFDGVITRRYADPGSLIQAGTASDTQSRPLVQLSDNYRLRLDFPVSVSYVKDIRNGDALDVRVESLNSKTFAGKISRFSQKVDEATRTMLTEIEVANPALELVPGMYATVALKVERRSQALAIPTEAISADRKSIVDVINRNQEIEERQLTLGLETPIRYEVVAGLQEGDLVVIGARSQVKPGQKVEPKVVETVARD